MSRGQLPGTTGHGVDVRHFREGLGSWADAVPTTRRTERLHSDEVGAALSGGEAAPRPQLTFNTPQLTSTLQC